MQRKTLAFLATAAWVAKAICEDVKNNTAATARVTHRRGLTRGRILVLSTETKKGLNKAVDYVINHPTYKHHIEP